jgi:hypothetical protein
MANVFFPWSNVFFMFDACTSMHSQDDCDPGTLTYCAVFILHFVFVIMTSLSTPINQVAPKIAIQEWWGAQSVKLTPTCQVSLLKSFLINQLLQFGILDKVQDIDNDRRQLIAHVQLINGRSANTLRVDVERKFLEVPVVIGLSNINIRDNFVELKIGQEYHVTLVFKRGIRQHANIIIDLIKEWLKQNPQDITPQCFSSSYFPVKY